MTNYPYILFNKSPLQLRLIGARGGRAFGRNQRLRRALLPTTPPDAVPLRAALLPTTAEASSWQRKYNVEIWDRQQFGFPCRQPLCASHGLAFWAMPVPTGNGELSITCLGLNRYAVTGRPTFQTITSHQ
jgi:hypothetical protein